MRGHGIDYFENSRRATLAQHAYAIANPNGFRGYGERSGGSPPATVRSTRRSRSTASRARSTATAARGASTGEMRDDGTIAPTAAGASIVFAPEIVDRRRCARCATATASTSIRPTASSTPSIRRCGRARAVQHGHVVRRGLVRHRLPRHRPGADRRDDREPAQRPGVETDAEEPLHRARPQARRVLRRLARRGDRAMSVRDWLMAPALAASFVSPVRLRATGVRHAAASGRWGARARWCGSWSRVRARATPACASRCSRSPGRARTRRSSPRASAAPRPDLAQLGNTWIPEFAALGAIAPLDERVAALRHGHPRPNTSPASGTPTWWTARLYGVPWYVDTRLLFYRTDLLAKAGCPAPRGPGPSGGRRWSGSRRAAGRTATRSSCRSTKPQPVILGSRAGAGLLEDGDRAATSARPALPPRPASTSTCSRRARPGVVEQRSRTSTSSSRAATSPCTSPARGTSASSGAGCRPRCRTAGRRRRCRRRTATHWPGVSVAGGVEPGDVPRLAAPGGGLEAGRVPVRARAAGAFLPAHRRPAGAPRAPGSPGLAGDPRLLAFRDPARSASRRRPRCRSGRRSRSRSGRSARAGDPRPARPSTTALAAARRARWIESSRSGAGCWQARRRAMHAEASGDVERCRRGGRAARRGRPGSFVAPALGAIFLFFSAAGRRRAALEPHRFRHLRRRRLAQPRFVGLENYAPAAARPAVLEALRNTSTSCVVGGPLTLAGVARRRRCW